MTDSTQKLDEILWSAIMHEPAPTKFGEEFKATWNEPVIAKAKQAILAWHNKQLEEVLDKIMWAYKNPLEGTGYVSIEHVIEFERNKLKEAEL